MNLTKTPKGTARGGGRGGGGRNGGRGYAYLLDGAHTRKAPSSTVSKTSTKCTKYEETADDDENLFPPTGDELTTSTNRKNKALTRSSPYGRQRKSEE